MVCINYGLIFLTIFGDLNDVETKEHHQVKISNRDTASQNLDDVETNRTWESIRI
jgi:hypothetical protein